MAEIAFENGQISNFEGLAILTLDWVNHTAYRRASLIDLYLHAKFHCTHARTFQTGLIRSAQSVTT